MSINSVQNFKTVALPLLGEKFVVVVGGGWWWWVVVETNFSVKLGPKLNKMVTSPEQLGVVPLTIGGCYTYNIRMLYP